MDDSHSHNVQGLVAGVLFSVLFCFVLLVSKQCLLCTCSTLYIKEKY